MAESADPVRPRVTVVQFGVFQLDLKAGELHKRGVKMRLQQQPFKVLEFLLERPGEVVAREDLRERLWPSDTWVDFDHGLNKAVNKLREALGDTADSPRFIETLAKRGYRFIAPVRVVDPVDPVGPFESAESAVTLPAAALTASVVPAPEAAVTGPRRPRLGHWLMMAGAAAGVALAWFLWPHAAVAPAPTVVTRVMLAVLPFDNLEADTAEDYFSDGMTEEIIQQLGRVNPARLGVIARTSSMHYKGSPKRLDEIARELSVEYVLEGAVRRSSQRIRISARLVRGADQTPLWSDSYERESGDVMDLQTEVGRRIADALTIEFAATPAPAASRAAPVGPDAYDAYLRGRYYWNRRGPLDLERALALLEQAVAGSPGYGAAAVALSDALNVLPWYGLRPPRETYQRSKDLAVRALALDPDSAAAHTALAYVHHYFDWDWPAAEQEYRRGLQINPSYAQAHQWLAAMHAERGRTDAALQEMRSAERLDPHAPIIPAAIGWIQYLARDFDPAIAQLRRTVERDPDFVPARLWLGQALEASGRPADAVEQYLAVRRVVGEARTGLGELARGLALAGQTARARAELKTLLRLAETGYVEADLIARVYDALGDRAQTLAWLERGLAERATKMTLLAVDPQYDRLRGDPAFVALLARVGPQP